MSRRILNFLGVFTFLTLFAAFGIQVADAAAGHFGGCTGQTGENPPGSLSISANTTGNSVTLSVNGQLSRQGEEVYLASITTPPNPWCEFGVGVARQVVGPSNKVQILGTSDALGGQNVTVSVNQGTDGGCDQLGCDPGDPSTYAGNRTYNYNTYGLNPGQTYHLYLKVEDNFGWNQEKQISFTVPGTAQHDLTIDHRGSCTATVELTPGQDCSDDCTRSFDSGEVVQTRAVNSGSCVFDHWVKDNGANSTANPRNITMNADKDIEVWWTQVTPACSDGSDNDGDGFTDYPNDGGCSSASDNDETGGDCVMTTQLKAGSPLSTGPVNVEVNESVLYDIDVISDNGNCGGGNYRKEIDFDGNGTWDYSSTNSANGAQTTYSGFSNTGTYQSKGRITALGPSPDVTANTNNVTVNVTEPASVQCSPSSQTINEDTSTSFSAAGGTGTFSWAVSPADSVPTTAGNTSNFNNVLFPQPGAHTVTVTRGATQDSCSVSVTDVCEAGGTVTVNSEDENGNPVPTTWILSGPEDYTPGSSTASWSDTVVVINPSSSYTVHSIENLPGYDTPTVDINPQAVSCGGSRTFTITYPLDTDPYVLVEPDPGSTTVGGTENFTACYDPDGAGPSNCSDITDAAIWSTSPASSGIAHYTGTAGAFQGDAVGSVLVRATYDEGSCGGGGVGLGSDLSCSDTATLNVSSGSSLSCSPATQARFVDEVASLSASGGTGKVDYAWSAPGGTPSSGTGSTFDVVYGTTGTKSVTLTRGSDTDVCEVDVTAAVCGNDICEVAGGETCNECSEDCGSCGLTECSDGVDNDADGLVDCVDSDPGCYPDGQGGGGACDPNDDSEDDGDINFEEF